MIDIHSHIVFDVDDGPKSIEESKKLLREAYSQGVRTIVSTSHRRKGMFETPEEKIATNFLKVREMAKEVAGQLKLQIKGGAANPSPPVGPALGAKGINIMEFCKQFNARTQDKQGKVIPVVITVYKDKSFDFIIKTAPAAVQLLEAAKVKGGSGEPNRKKVASITWDQVKAIAEDKMPDLSAFTLESAMSMIAGTARSMGITVTGEKPF